MTFVTTVTISVYILGFYTEEIGFYLRTVSGLLVVSRVPGTSFSAISVLGTFVQIS